MKKVWVSLGFGILAVAIFVAPMRAGNIKEADYPNQYEVMDSGKSGGKLALEKGCSMRLRDKAKADVAITVSRSGLGSCHVLDTGKVYRGRENEKKNRIELVIPVGTDKAKVEEWQIVGTVDINPK